MYLRIANPGNANPEALITIGLSTTRSYNGSNGLIGQFGSGSKHAISLMIRNNLSPIIYISNLQMHFNVKNVYCEDQEFHKVIIKYAGKDLYGNNKSSTEETGFTTEWGELDWTDINMGLREFVANAIDACIKSGHSYEDIEIDFVEKPRAKKGWTQVFIPVNDAVRSYYHELPFRFLHFRKKNLLNSCLLPKMQSDKVRIYKHGVLVHEIDNVTSVYDYNLGNELKLDESRNSTDWNVKYACAIAIAAKATENEIQNIIKGVTNNNSLWESKLDSSYICGKYVLSDEKQTENKDKWKKAWKEVYGDLAVACDSSSKLKDFVVRKGYTPVMLTNDLLNFFNIVGVTTQDSVLSGMEKKGRNLCSPTVEMTNAVDNVWQVFEKMNLLNGKTKPKVMGFSEIMIAESQVMGEYIDGTVYLSTDLSGYMLMKVTLEEVVHHITDAGDFSRDIQDYLFRVITDIFWPDNSKTQAA